jgi:hypothetical protein
MRFTPSPLRALTTSASIVLLSLLTVSLADAAPRRAASGPICDPQTPVARKLPRHPRSFGGPVKHRSSAGLAGLQDLATARIRRGTHAFLGENAAVIQNDTPVNETDASDCLTPSLRSIEIIGALVVHPRSRAFSPRSPRGPPLPA